MFPVHCHTDAPRDHVTRRSFVRAGVLGASGLALPDLLRLRAEAGTDAERKDTSVILFWLSGGPGHMETFDPKPDAPQEYRGPLGSVATTLPGVRFGELLPRLATLADRLAVVRTVHHGTGDHTKGNHWMLTGFEGPAFNAPDNRRQRRPAMGSAVAKVRGSNSARVPAYCAVPHLRGGTDNVFHYAAYLGGGCNPFIVNSDPNSDRFRVPNLSLSPGLTRPRVGDRLGLLKSLDALDRSLAESRSSSMRDLDQYHAQAADLLTSRRFRDAFDIDSEPDALRDSYGRHTFGQSALVARRLVEAGSTFVTVNCEPWDHHGSNNRFQTEVGARKLIPPLDDALAGLVTDLHARGLDRKTLVVAMGEFGRTPRVNQYAGRDHWGRTFSVMFACGGIEGGQMIGRSDARGEDVVTRPTSPEDVAATVYRHLGIDGANTWFHDHLDRPLPLIADGQPIRELT